VSRPRRSALVSSGKDRFPIGIQIGQGLQGSHGL
jgi:hypothetical protein